MKNIALLVLAMFIISCNKNNEKAAFNDFPFLFCNNCKQSKCAITKYHWITYGITTKVHC